MESKYFGVELIIIIIQTSIRCTLSTLKGESEAPSYYTNLKRHLANQFLSVAMKSNGRSLPETEHSTVAHKFAKYRPIFKILSLADEFSTMAA